MNLIFAPPPIEAFVLEDYWAIHEAAFSFTHWPKQDLFQNYLCFTLKNAFPGFTVKRSSVYLPSELSIDPTQYGKEFETLYYDLKEAVERKSLGSLTHRIIDVQYFVKPRDAILWAILKGYTLPSGLQKAIDTNQDNRCYRPHTKTHNLLLRHVREKIIAQFYLASNPPKDRTELCKKVLHYFDQLYCKNTNIKPIKKDLTTIRNNLNELYNSLGLRGASKKDHPIERIDYTPKPIPEVVKQDGDGNSYYNFPLLKEVMLHGAYFMIVFMEEHKLKINSQENFIKEFLENEVIDLYLQRDNEYVMAVAKRCADEAWECSQFLTHDRSRLQKHLTDNT